MFAELFKSEVGWVGGRGLWGEEPPPSVSWVGALARAVRYESATKKISKKMGNRKNNEVHATHVKP